jgi:hypothetical protein
MWSNGLLEINSEPFWEAIYGLASQSKAFVPTKGRIEEYSVIFGNEVFLMLSFYAHKQMHKDLRIVQHKNLKILLGIRL